MAHEDAGTGSFYLTGIDLADALRAKLSDRLG